MRDLLSKVMTGSMVAGAALLVAACGGGEDAAANNVATNYVEDPLMGANDVTPVDAMNGTDANLGVTTDANAMTTTTTTNTTTTDTATNTGTGNTTGM
jgi:hypothetical protein